VAEEYHQDYYKKNPYASYCQYVIKPKVKKARKTLGLVH
jgi:peptide-methionine (S)-S-oxide reductase